MKVIDLLRSLNFGNSVAEFDQDLEKYFLETDTYDALESGQIDIVAGDKGTGKTALYTILNKRLSNHEIVEAPEIVLAFNPSGSPVFQKLADKSPQDEPTYINIWKAYFFSICGNWLLQSYGAEFSPEMTTLNHLLTGMNLRIGTHAAEPVFTRLMSRIENLLNWEAAEMALDVGTDGSLSVRPRVELGAREQQTAPSKIDLDQALRHLDRCMASASQGLWIAMDRLDEAFQGNPDIEIPALRALFRTFLDFQTLQRISLKLFVRRDLFRRITQGGFVNLTHINACKREIIWDEEDLKSLLCKRIRQNSDLIQALDLDGADDEKIFGVVFPDQVDFGKRKPKTWVWMMRRIRDGNDVKPPRNLIDLVTFAVQTQSRSEARTPREFVEGVPIIESESLRRALFQLSGNRVTDTLLAEAKGLSEFIEMFRRGKSEHNDNSIAATLSVSLQEAQSVAKSLTEIGFLERIKGNYKIPSLYRDGLEITQGKAFD